MKKIPAYILILILLAATSYATVYLRTESALRYLTGGQVVVASNAQVWVYSAGTTSLSTIYSDVTSSTTITQPIITDRYGNYSYYAPAGMYDESIVGPAGTIAVTRTNIYLGTFTTSTFSAVCWKTHGTLGYCSSAPTSTGTCTCN